MRRRRRFFWVAVVGWIAVVAAGVVVAIRHRARPIAEGRATDACPAQGPAGLVGLDLATGEVRWTNVVGDDVADLWAPASRSAGGAGSGARAYVLGSDGSVRRVVAETGAVDRCPAAASLRPADGRVPTTLDGRGALAAHRPETGGRLGTVAVTDPDGTVRWEVSARELVGSAPGAVVVRADEGADCCAGPPDLDVEVREAETGEVRWRAELQGLEATVTSDLLVVTDQFDGAGVPSDHRPPDGVRVTAYDLADGRVAWRAHVDGWGSTAFAGDDTVFVPAGQGHPELVALDAGTGRVRWTARLPTPGLGGPNTEYGGMPEVAVAGDTVVAVVQSTTPYRD